MNRAAAVESVRQTVAEFANPDGRIVLQGVDVHGSGANTTSPRLLNAYVRPLLTAETVDELVTALDTTQQSLMSLGIFQDAVVSLDGPQRVVSIELPAAKRFIAKTGTKVGQAEGSGYFTGTLRNYFGYGEILTVDTSTGTRTRAAQLADLSMPIPHNAFVGWKAQILGYTSERLVDWASHRARIHGVTARLQSAQHSLGIDAVLRTVMASKLRVSDTVQQSAGPSFKFSIFWNWQRDTRPQLERFLSTSGSYVGLRNELALGPFSDFPFFKTAFDMRRGFRIGQSPITGSVSTRAGMLVPLGPRGSHLFDRFTLGGALDVRGFRINGAGPHDGFDAVGGNVLGAAGLSLYSPIPRVSSPNLRLHAFTNTGMLAHSLRDLALPSLSAGFGVLYAHPSARFELNVAMPLVAHAGEGLHKGLQFGIGLEFL